MTKPQEPKQYGLSELLDFDDRIPYMLAEEAIAYAEAVRNEALDEAAQVCYAQAKHHHDVYSDDDALHSEQFPNRHAEKTLLDAAERIRSLKREGK